MLDNRAIKIYNVRALRESGPGRAEEREKSLKKFEKGVDKGARRWYNKQAVRKERQRKLLENWTTKRQTKTPKILLNFIKKLFIVIERITLMETPGNRDFIQLFREFDPGSGWTLAACITHSSRTVTRTSVLWSVADGWVTREQPAFQSGITSGNGR